MPGRILDLTKINIKLGGDFSLFLDQQLFSDLHYGSDEVKAAALNKAMAEINRAIAAKPDQASAIRFLTLAYSFSPELYELLLNQEPDLALHYASTESNIPNKTETAGLTLLMLNSRTTFDQRLSEMGIKCIKILLRYGADPLAISNVPLFLNTFTLGRKGKTAAEKFVLDLYEQSQALTVVDETDAQRQILIGVVDGVSGCLFNYYNRSSIITLSAYVDELLKKKDVIQISQANKKLLIRVNEIIESYLQKKLKMLCFMYSGLNSGQPLPDEINKKIAYSLDLTF